MAIGIGNILAALGLAKGSGRGDNATETKLPPPEPSGAVYFVGDIHGRADLLKRLLDMIDADMQAQGIPTPELVFAGDYVDRGEESREVLEILPGLSRTFRGNVRCLTGNHERMMLDFLDDPEDRGPRWLRNGGLQTLASFSVGGMTERAPPYRMAAAANALRQALPPGLEDWLRGLPDRWISGNLACVHAALDPALPLEAQDPDTLIWGHPRFQVDRRTDGLWIAHGHTVVDRASAESGRIATDTGAYFTGRLSAAVIVPGEPVRFLGT